MLALHQTAGRLKIEYSKTCKYGYLNLGKSATRHLSQKQIFWFNGMIVICLVQFILNQLKHIKSLDHALTNENIKIVFKH